MSDTVQEWRPVLPTANDVWIDDDVAVADLMTEAECANAFNLVTEQIVAIEAQVDEYKAGTRPFTAEWHKRAKGALRYKRAALQLIQTRQAEIRRAVKEATTKIENERFERFFINTVRQWAPDVYERACAEAIRQCRALSSAPLPAPDGGNT